MKRMIALVLIFVCVLSFAGCDKADAKKQDSSSTSLGEPETTVSYAKWQWDSLTIIGCALNKDKASISSVKHLPIYKMDTKQDLEQFKSGFASVVSGFSGYDEVPSFESATLKYDEAFFEENSLLVVYVDASSGSLRFGVSDVYCDGESLCVHVKQTNNPEIVTDDMAAWFITVAVKDSIIANCKSFDADLINQ